MTDNPIEFNQQFLHAFHVMEETSRNVFITGKAGTGKSTLLRFFRENTKKDVAILAPTGVAAVNVRGQTIHSFFGFRPDVTPHGVTEIRPRRKKLYKKIDAIVIDEVSMVRADLLDCIDTFLRIHGKKRSLPFGGIQMIFIGDLYQLPPVLTTSDRTIFKEYYKGPYFFNARVFQEGFNVEYIELEKVYRQRDESFLELLNKIRNNTATESDLAKINSRHIPDFDEGDDFYIHLTTTNRLSDAINQKRLEYIAGKEYRYRGVIDGNFTSRDLPTGLDLTMKVGAQVMLLNNDSMGRWINGSIGRVEEIERKKGEDDVIWVELQDGEYVDILPYTWEIYEFYFERKLGRVKSRVTGSFTQYPLKLAWAITIHKSQGMTFDRVVIDIGDGIFSHGQLYVALSRCTRLDGIILKKPIEKRHMLMDRRVVEFVTTYQYRQAENRHGISDRITFIEEAIQKDRRIEIVYLKTRDEKSRRVIIPSYVGEMEYRGKKFIGVRGFCTRRREERVFHIERILEMEMIE